MTENQDATSCEDEQDPLDDKEYSYLTIKDLFQQKCLNIKHLPLNAHCLDEYITFLVNYSNADITKFTQNRLSIIKYLKLSEDGKKTLLHKETGKQVVSVEALFKYLFVEHVKLKHKGGIPALRVCLDHKYYIPYYVYKYFVQSCPLCGQKNLKEIVGNKRVYLDWLNPRVVSLNNDGDFKFILIKYDLETQFVLLRPLHGVELPEIANELLKLFLDFGTPKHVQCSSINATLFNSACGLLHKDSLTTTKIIMKPVDHTMLAATCAQILKAVKEWTIDNKSKNWSVGCYEVQNKLNNIQNASGSSPYDYVFKRTKVYSDLFETDSDSE